MFDSLKTVINEHISFRKQIVKLAKSDLIKTYSGSALGWLWALAKPLTTILVYWFAFSVGFKQTGSINGYPYILWLVAGLVPWFYMSNMLSKGMYAMRAYSYLITKMKFPVSTISTIVSISNIIVNFSLMAIAILVYVLMGHSIDIYFLQLPFYYLLMFSLFTSWSLFSAPLAAISKDFYNMIKSGIMAVLWVSGILWNPRTMGDSIPALKTFLAINPVTYLVEGFRGIFIYKEWFFERPQLFMNFMIVLLIMFSAGLLMQKKLKKDIPDVL